MYHGILASWHYITDRLKSGKYVITSIAPAVYSIHIVSITVIITEIHRVRVSKMASFAC